MFLKTSCICTLFLALVACSSGKNDINTQASNIVPLPIPSLLKYTVNSEGEKVFDLVVKNGEAQLKEGAKTKTVSYTGSRHGRAVYCRYRP